MSLAAVGKALFGPCIFTETCQPNKMDIISRIGAYVVPAMTYVLHDYKREFTLSKTAVILTTFTAGIITAFFLDLYRTEKARDEFALKQFLAQKAAIMSQADVKASDEYALAQCLNREATPTDAAMTRVLSNPSLTTRLIEGAKTNTLSRPSKDSKVSLMQKVALQLHTEIFLAFLKSGSKLDYLILMAMMKSKEGSAQKNLKAFLALKNPKLINIYNSKFPDDRSFEQPLLTGCPVEMIKELVAFGINPNAAGSFGTTALGLARYQDDRARTQALLAEGAYPNTLTSIDVSRITSVVRPGIRLQGSGVVFDIWRTI